MSTDKFPIRALIADDVPLARERIRLFLADEPDLEIIGEAGTAREAIHLAVAAEPDLIFLDIKFPDADGFHVLNQLPSDLHPVVIFLTAYDKHALQAFEVDALDYLLKPVTRERLERAIVRARQRLKERRERKMRAISPAPSYLCRLAIDKNSRTEFVDVKSIDWIEASGHYVQLHSGNNTYLLRMRIADLERELDPQQFTRIHRSFLVRLDQIRALEPRRNGDCTLYLHTGARLALSRKYRESVQRRLQVQSGA